MQEAKPRKSLPGSFFEIEKIEKLPGTIKRKTPVIQFPKFKDAKWVQKIKDLEMQSEADLIGCLDLEGPDWKEWPATARMVVWKIALLFATDIVEDYV